MDLSQRIRSYLTATSASGLDNVSDDDLLFEEGIIDSTAMLDFISFLETEFRIKIDDDEIRPENFGSIVAIVNYMSKKTQ